MAKEFFSVRRKAVTEKMRANQEENGAIHILDEFSESADMTTKE